MRIEIGKKYYHRDYDYPIVVKAIFDDRVVTDSIDMKSYEDHKYQVIHSDGFHETYTLDLNKLREERLLADIKELEDAIKKDNKKLNNLKSKLSK